ncbi:MAG: PKD domain-containing protein [Candidatus Andersenbacteria bacterium]|nr:PKD domain-containing protein [Candidatus Andersenbacteria bacterium]
MLTRLWRVSHTLLALLFLVATVLLSAPFAYAQEGSEVLSEDVITGREQEAPVLKAVAGNDRNVAIDRKVLFDASSSSLGDQEDSASYTWDFGDGSPLGEGIDVTHTYTQAGDFTAQLRITVGDEVLTDELVVSVYEDIVLLVADGSPTAAELESLKQHAFRQGILLDTVVHSGTGADYVVEGELVDSLIKARDDVAKTEVIVVWTKGSLGVNVLTSFASKAENIEDLNFAKKGIVVVTDQSLSAVSRLAQSAFDALRPEYVLLTQEEALTDVVAARTSSNVLREVQQSGVSSRLIGVYSGRASELSWNNFLSFGVNLMINRGVAVENILLLLMLPIIATIVAIARQVFGVKTFGIYTPSIITLAFVVTGLRLGLAVFIIVLIVATAMRYIMRWFRLSYMPRMAIVLTVVAATIFFVLLAGALSGRTSVILLSIFPVLVLVMLTERFVTAQAEKGLGPAVLLSVETMLVAVAAYLLVTWPSFRTFILAYPEVILLTLVLNAAAGKWTGLRVSEYFRFRAVRRQSSGSDSEEESSSQDSEAS